jgi:hypothetical protein
MNPELAEKLIASLDAIVEALRLIRTFLIILTAMIVPVFVDVMFRTGWLCWLDLKRRREERLRRRRPEIQRRHERSRTRRRRRSI